MITIVIFSGNSIRVINIEMEEECGECLRAALEEIMSEEEDMCDDCAPETMPPRFNRFSDN